MRAPYHLFEVAWDPLVHDAAGLPPPFHRARATSARFGDRWVVVAPRPTGDDSGGRRVGFDRESGYAAFEEACAESGFVAEVVRWNVEGRPLGILVEGVAPGARRDAVLSRLWRTHRIDSLFGGSDYVRALLFGHAAGLALALWWAEAAARHPGAAVVAAHGVRAGVALLALRDTTPDVGTVYVLDEAVLGSASATDVPKTEDPRDVASEEPRAEPIERQAEHTVELACATAADVLAATSPRAAESAQRWLGRAADAVLPPGVEAPSAPATDDERRAARTRLDRVAAAALGRSVEGAAHVALSDDDGGDGGLSLALDALAVVDRRPGRTIVAWALAPAASSGLRADVAARLAGDVSAAGSAANATSTHALVDASHDAVERRVARGDLGGTGTRRVLLVRVPVALGEKDGLFDVSRAKTLGGYDAVAHLATSPASDRAALASLAAGAPVVVTDGSALAQETWRESDAVAIVHVEGVPREEAVLDAATAIGAAAAASRDRERDGRAALEAARRADWSASLPRHEDVWREALARAAERRDAPAPVEPAIPAPLEGLAKLGRDFHWTWDPDAPSLFEDASPGTWRAVRHSPIRLVRALASHRTGPWMAPEFQERVRAALERRKDALGERGEGGADPPRKGRDGGHAALGPIAYFSAEYGVHESLPVYGGGLGILAADHLKAASDLGVPLVAIGLLYRRGRTRQRLGKGGDQRLLAAWTDPRDLALEPVRDESGRALEVEVPYAGATLLARAWRARVGRVPLYLLDTDVSDNAPDVRTITHVLYPADAEARLAQEIVLGRGGTRLLERLGLVPRSIHLNEGHPAFAALERVAQLVRDGSRFEDAVERVRESTAFTTHTPVPAGHDRFDESLVLEAAPDLAAALGVESERVLGLGRDAGRFNMTRLAISLCGRVNAVSEIHAQVSRRLLASAWPGVEADRVPIGHVTNGVHLATWTHRSVARSLGVADRAIRGADFTSGARTVDLEALWAARQPLRRRLLERTRAGLERAFAERRLAAEEYDCLRAGLDEKALLVGFARRFAGYKRANLVLRDAARLERLLGDAERPVRLLFAGKAHASDRDGQAVLRDVARAAREGPLAGKLFVLEDYGLSLARTLVQGSDVWLNLPRRGLEASGTSGMKAAANGALHVSIADGWWAEAADGENGWTVGARTAPEGGADAEDAADATALFDLLEQEIVPLFFHRDAQGVPWKWLSRVQHSLATIPARFDAQRMVREYVERAYSAPSRAKA